MTAKRSPARGSRRYIPIRLSRSRYLAVVRRSPAIVGMVYPHGCWSQRVIVDAPMLECLLLACRLNVTEVL